MAKRHLTKLNAERGGDVVLPHRTFLYTLDQIALLLNIKIESLPQHVRFMNVGLLQKANDGPEGKRGDSRMRAVQLVPSAMHGESKEWRIPDMEVERYFKLRGIILYERKAAHQGLAR